MAEHLPGRGRRTAPRVGLFGILGTGNIGNDAQLETVLNYLHSRHPEAVIDAMCTGRPERLRADFGLQAVHVRWRHESPEQTWRGGARQGAASANGVRTRRRELAALTKTVSIGLGVITTTFRIASWVRRHDAVIVPGSGMLETSMPLRLWETPYSLFVLCLSGRLFKTKVALVSVGANLISQPVTRWFLTRAARLAHYRSYRDAMSRDAMNSQGVGTTDDRVYPDLAFGLPPSSIAPGDPQVVGLGVAAYYGTNDERRTAADLHCQYVAAMERFVSWLLQSGRRVHLFVGDTNGGDDDVIREILGRLRQKSPEIDLASVTVEHVTSFAQLMKVIEPVGTVVAMRYHNVLCGIKLGKPTLSIGYSLKHDSLMADAGLPDFCQAAHSLDVDRLIRQYLDAQARGDQLRRVVLTRHEELARQLDAQFSALSAVLLGPARLSSVAEPSSRESVDSPLQA